MTVRQEPWPVGERYLATWGRSIQAV